MLRFTTIILFLIFSHSLSIPGRAEQHPHPLLQRDWMRGMVEALGWSFGLPDEPRDSDYLRILSGHRSYRIEAEKAKQKTDRVAVKSFGTFGAFSGTGWVSGIATPTPVHLKFLLPLAGTYRIKAALRLPGHTVRIAGETFEVSAESVFTEVELGEFRLDAGMQEVIFELPPSGAIDYLQLDAPDLKTVQPLEGWKPEQPLERSDLAVTAVRVLGAEGCLPPRPEQILVEAETVEDRAGSQIEKVRYLGTPSGGFWLRAGANPAKIELLVRIDRAAAYRISLSGVGRRPSSVQVDEGPLWNVTWPPYLAMKEAGTVYLEPGMHRLRIALLPGTGIDVVQFQALHSAPGNYLRLAGMTEDGDVSLMEESDRLLSLLAAIGASR